MKYNPGMLPMLMLQYREKFGHQVSPESQLAMSKNPKAGVEEIQGYLDSNKPNPIWRDRHKMETGSSSMDAQAQLNQRIAETHKRVLELKAQCSERDLKR